MQKPIIILCSLIFSVSLTAQQGQMRGRTSLEQVEAEKIAFFTRYLELSSREAQEFWPVYNDFQNRKNKINQERQNLSRYFAQNSANLSDSEAREIADRYIDLQIQEARLTGEYHKKFMEVLPPGKVMLFYQAENEFRMQLLRRLRGGRGPGM